MQQVLANEAYRAGTYAAHENLLNLCVLMVWGPQLVEAHLIPGTTLRAADLQPGALYQTALAGAFLTVRLSILSTQLFLHATILSPVFPREQEVIHLHALGTRRQP